MNEPMKTLDDERLEYVNSRSVEIGKELFLINMRFNGDFAKVADEIGRILSEIEFTARILNEQVEHLLNVQASATKSMQDGTEHFSFRCDKLSERINKLEIAFTNETQSKTIEKTLSMPKGDPK